MVRSAAKFKQPVQKEALDLRLIEQNSSAIEAQQLGIDVPAQTAIPVCYVSTASRSNPHLAEIAEALRFS